MKGEEEGEKDEGRERMERGWAAEERVAGQVMSRVERCRCSHLRGTQEPASEGDSCQMGLPLLPQSQRVCMGC